MSRRDAEARSFWARNSKLFFLFISASLRLLARPLLRIRYGCAKSFSHFSFQMKAIVAMAENRVIGNGGTIPWHLPEDFRFFKATTLGHGIVMGRKTYASIGKPLPGRRNIILSRTMPEMPGVIIVRSPEELLQLPDADDFFVIGGAEIYQRLLPYCTELFVTKVLLTVEGDTFFPEFESAFDTGTKILETNDFSVWRYQRIKKGYPVRR